MAQALGHATTHYAKAAELTRYLDDPYLTLVIEFAAAETTWAEGQLLYISHAYDEAMVKMNSAIERFTVGEDSLLNQAIGRGDDRLVTKAYQTLGVAYFQLSDMLRIQGQPAERMAHLRKAEELFQQCVAKKDDAFLDKLIKDEMVADFCQPQLEETQRALADLLAQEGGE